MPIEHPELRASLERLFARQTFGIKLGLESTLALLDSVGAPHRSLRVIHVAGTNGKGSVCAMIASILTESGVRVGLYSSPHLIDFRERMRIDGTPISEERLALYAAEMMPEIERIGSTFFEGTTAIAFRYFADEKVDVVVLETGMGGRLDSTNVVDPLVSVITSIGLDHTRHLGESFEEIAREKGGIIKPGRPAVVGPVRPRLRAIFEEIAAAVEAPIRFVDDVVRAVHEGTTLNETIGSFIVDGRETAHVAIDLPGVHQIENARTALAALDAVSDVFPVDEEMMRRGFRAIRANSGIAGRFQLVRESPRVILDVAHNPDGVAVLMRTLEAAVPVTVRVHAVVGAVREKDVAGVAAAIAPRVATLHAVRADNERSLPSDEIAHHARAAGIETIDAGSVAAGIAGAIDIAAGDDIVLIFGSFFVVGEAIETLQGASATIAERTGVYSVLSTPPSETTIRERVVEKEEKKPKKGNVADEPTRVPSARLTVKEWDPHEQPRERLVALGPGALSDAELLAILLRTGTRDKDVVAIARELLHAFNDRLTEDRLVDLVGRDLRELQGIGGIGPTKAIMLAAAFELGNRVVARAFSERPIITHPRDVARLFIPRMRGLRKEQFHVIILNTAGQVIRTELVSEGNLNSSVVHAREVYRTAIVESAAAVIGLHNHPSGNPTPSREDIAVTKQLVEAGRLLGIPFHDHIIIAGDDFVSLVQEGLV